MKAGRDLRVQATANVKPLEQRLYHPNTGLMRDRAAVTILFRVPDPNDLNEDKKTETVTKMKERMRDVVWRLLKMYARPERVSCWYTLDVDVRQFHFRDPRLQLVFCDLKAHYVTPSSLPILSLRYGRFGAQLGTQTKRNGVSSKIETFE